MKCENIIIGQGTKYPLKGLLTLPDNLNHKVPAIVLVHGSGSSDMDERVYQMTPFKDLAEGLAKRGIATIRYDKRTYTHGLKMAFSKEVITVKEETINDALLAKELLLKDNRIDHDNIYLLGHSMGGMLVPRMDDEGNFKGLIIMAGTLRKLEDIFMDQTKEMKDTMSKLLNFILDGQINKISKAFSNMYEVSDDVAKKTKLGNGMTLYYFTEMGRYPSTTSLKEKTKPILIMQGDKDSQVSVTKDYELYKEILSDNPNVTFKLYEGLNHCFVKSLYEGIANVKKEYSVKRHIEDNVLDDIANWLLSH